MSDVFIALTAALALLALVTSVRALRCNLRHLHTARTTAPLDGIDLSAATVAPFPAPKTWPVVEEVTDPAVAAAYASFADDLALTYIYVGDIAMVVGGAALGATSISADSDWWKPLPALLVAGVGVGARLIATRKWETLYVRYLDQYAALTDTPAPPPVARRRGLFGWLRG